MKRSLLLTSCFGLITTGAIFLGGCTSKTTAYSLAQGQFMEYHGTDENPHYVLFTNIFDDADGNSERANSDYLTLKGFMRKEGYLPVEYRSNGRTFTFYGDNYEMDYTLSEGRVFLVDARPNQATPVVTQVKLSPDEEAVFLAQWRQSKSDAVETLTADPRVKAFLDGSKTTPAKP